MKMKAIANYVKKQADVKNVYLFNQDYRWRPPSRLSTASR